MVSQKVPSDFTPVYGIPTPEPKTYLNNSFGQKSGPATGHPHPIPLSRRPQARPSMAHNPWRGQDQNGPLWDGQQGKAERNIQPKILWGFC